MKRKRARPPPPRRGKRLSFREKGRKDEKAVRMKRKKKRRIRGRERIGNF